MEQKLIVLNTSEMTIGRTVYTVRAIQSKNARETADEKLKRIICRHLSDARYDHKVQDTGLAVS